MKRYFSLAMILIFAMLSPLNAAADQASAMAFWSIEEFRSYLSECRQSGAFNAIGPGYSQIDGIYIPAAFVGQNDAVVDIGADYYSHYFVTYQFGTTRLSFATYFDANEGPFLYEYAQRQLEGEASNWEPTPKQTEIAGNTVYSYGSAAETWHVWRQDGIYHYLLVNKKPDDQYLQYCNAAYLPLNLSSTASYNPSTGR